MGYISVAEASKRWGISERSVRKYCAEGRVEGAALVGKTWTVPEGAEKPTRKNAKSKSELLAEVVALLQSPIKNVVSALQSGGNTIHGVLKTLGERE